MFHLRRFDQKSTIAYNKSISRYYFSCSLLMTYNEIIARFKKLKNPRNIEGMKRFGIRPNDKVYGVNIPVIRCMGKQIGKNTELALQLWDSKIHEARILATIIAEADNLTAAQLDKWVSELKSWDTNDQLCGNLLWRIAKPEIKINKWSKDKREFVRRAGIVLLAALAVKNKKLPDSFFEKYFPLLKKYSVDERVYVKKAISWALREIGKCRSEKLRLKTIKLAEEIKKLDTPSARWIASDVIRELSKRKARR